MSEYSADRIKLTALPVPVRRGAWWVHSWTITASREFSFDEFEFPEPHLDDEGIFLVLLRIERDALFLDILEKSEVISPKAFVFASQLANAMRSAFGPGVAVDGDTENPLFWVVRQK